MATGKWRMEIWHNGTGSQKNVTIPITVTYGGKTINVNAGSQKQVIDTGFENTLGSRLSKSYCNINGSYSIVNGVAYSGIVTTQFDEFQSGKEDEDDYEMTSEYASNYYLMFTFYYGTIFDMSYFITNENGIIEANTEKESSSVYQWFNRCSTNEHIKANYFEVGCARSFYLDTSGGRAFVWFPKAMDVNGGTIDGVRVKILDANKHDITSKFDMFTFKKWENNLGWYLANAGNIYILKEGEELPSGRYRILTEEFLGHTFYQNDYEYFEPEEETGDNIEINLNLEQLGNREPVGIILGLEQKTQDDNVGITVGLEQVVSGDNTGVVIGLEQVKKADSVGLSVSLEQVSENDNVGLTVGLEQINSNE